MSAPDVAKVELKVTVGGAEVERAVQVFALADDDAKRRRIWFGEVLADPPLPLAARGLIVRVRLAKRKATATLKLRGPQGCLDPAAWDRRAQPWGDRAKLEGDWSGSRRLVSGSLDNDVESDDPIAEPRTAADVEALLSDEQLGLVEDWLVPLGRLVPVGPVVADSWSDTLDTLPEEVSFERWTLGEDLRFLEVSMRVPAALAEALAPRLEAVVTGHGLTVDPGAATKTDTVLRRLVADRLAR